MWSAYISNYWEGKRLYIISLILLLISLFLSNRNGEMDILFWVGLLVVAAAMMVGASEKNEKHR